MSEKTYCFWNNQQIDCSKPPKYADKPVSAIIGWGGLQLFDDSVNVVALCYEYSKAIQENSCGQCIPCRAGTRVIRDIMEKIVNGEGCEADLDALLQLAMNISQSSMCEIGQSSPLVFIELIKNYRDSFLEVINKKAKISALDYEFKTILTAPCMQACPIHLDIPKYIEEIKYGRFETSLDVIRERLPLPGVVGRVCVRPCEFNCRRGLIDEPLQIKHLKRFVADFERERSLTPQFSKAEPKDIKVAIIGAGPAGLTAAFFLAKLGYQVTIFESLPEPGGMAGVGIPDYRLPREILGGEVSNIEKLGVKILYNKNFGIDFSIEDLENEGFKAFFVGLGCHCHKKLDIEGEDQSLQGYIPGVYFLRYINLNQEIPKGKKIVVVGGGNVAMDCVRSAVRMGFEDVNIVYRRSKKEMPADFVEVMEAEEEGVKFHMLTAPKRLISKDGKVVGLECIKMELGEPDASGRRSPVPVPGSEFIIETDVLVPAIGQEADIGCCVTGIKGVEITKKATIKVDENFMSTRMGVFAGGDCVTGADVLIRACAHGRLAAIKIDKFLKGEKVELLPEEYDVNFVEPLKPYLPTEKMKIPGGIKRVPIKHDPPHERIKSFMEYTKGYSNAEAIDEASRCLRCYRIVTYAYAK